MYKRQGHDDGGVDDAGGPGQFASHAHEADGIEVEALFDACLLYTSDAADALLCVDIGGRRIITKKTVYTTQV